MTQEEIKEMNQAFLAFKTANDEMQAEVKKFGTTNGVLQGKVEQMSTTLDAIEKKINTRMDAEEFGKFKTELMTQISDMEAKFSKKGVHGAGAGDEDKAKAILAKEAFFGALRWTPLGQKSLEEVLGPEKIKALILGNDTQGGYLAPVEYVNEIIIAVQEYCNIRSLVRVRPTSRTSVQFPKRTGHVTASWVAETGTRPETGNPSFGMLDIPTHELYAMTKVSKQELEDSAFNLESFLNEEFSEQFGVTEADAFINGNGVGKPEGILSVSSISSVNSGSATALLPDSLIEAYYALKEVYLNNSTWLMNRSTLKEVRKMKDQQDQYLWAPGLKSDARPATILDRPYLTAPEMPVIAGDAYPVLFGDFRRGYLVVDRIVMEMMNDPYSSKSTGMVEFSARRRVGGKVILGEALTKIKIHTA